MKRSLTLISLLLISISYCQNLSICEDINTKRYGYCNDSGNKVIDYLYVRAYNFIDEYAIVQKDSFSGPWGVINKMGEAVIPFDYDKICPFKNESFIVEKDSFMVGILSPLNDTILPFYQSEWGITSTFSQYRYRAPQGPDSIYDASFIIYHNGKMDYWYDGKILFDFEYDNVRKTTMYFNDYGTVKDKISFFIVEKGEQMKMIDAENQNLFDFPTFDSYHSSWTESESHIQIVKKNSEVFFFDLDKEQVLTDISGTLITEKNKAKVMIENGSYGLMGPDREMIIPFKYDMMFKMEFYPNLFIVNKDNLWGIVSLEGNFLQPLAELVENYANAFKLDGHSYMSSSDPYLVKKEDKLAMCFSDGKRVFDLKYKQLGMLRYAPSYDSILECIFAGNPGKIQIYNRSENLISDFTFQEVYGMWYKTPYAVVKHQDKIKYYDIATDTLIEKIQVKKYLGLCSVRNIYGYYGLFDGKGNQYLPFEFDYLEWNGGNYYVLEKDGRQGRINIDGDRTIESIEWMKEGKNLWD